jgi:hypothetical protein
MGEHRRRSRRMMLGWIRFLNLVFFYGATSLVLVGLGVGVSGYDRQGEILLLIGFSTLGMLVAHSYFVLPFLRCPHCQEPFFVLRGYVGVISRCNPHRYRCIHCGWSMREKKVQQDESRNTLHDDAFPDHPIPPN